MITSWTGFEVLRSLTALDLNVKEKEIGVIIMIGPTRRGVMSLRPKRNPITAPLNNQSLPESLPLMAVKPLKELLVKRLPKGLVLNPPLQDIIKNLGGK